MLEVQSPFLREGCLLRVAPVVRRVERHKGTVRKGYLAVTRRHISRRRWSRGIRGRKETARRNFCAFLANSSVLSYDVKCDRKTPGFSHPQTYPHRRSASCNPPH